jgi:MoaA/NifB/PqqE/SkfB family radical SAM enzyme
MGTQREPTPGEYADAARKLGSFGTMMISMAGGEPLLRTDMPEIVRAVGRWHFPFITTNGWFVTPELARELMQAGVWGVSVSVDYASPQPHDAQRGVRGAWKQAWRAVELLSAARVHRHQRVNVMCVLRNDNLDELEALVKMAADREAYFMIQPYSRLKTGSTSYEPSPGSLGPRLLALRDRWPNFLSNRSYLSRFDEYLAGGVPGCRAGQAFFNIDSVGDIAICVERRDEPLANLFRDAPREIHQRLRQAGQLTECRKCWYNCRGEVESLYEPLGLLRSLPTYLLDRGRAVRPDAGQPAAPSPRAQPAGAAT